MPKVVRSAKGKEVNFDMLKIKQQIASAPKPTSVRAREDFIDQKFKRRLKRLKRGVAQKTADNKEEPKVEEKPETNGK
jgi:hypothetical protein